MWVESAASKVNLLKVIGQKREAGGAGEWGGLQREPRTTTRGCVCVCVVPVISSL